MSNYIYQLVVGLLLPLVGTTLGCSMIFILKKDIDKKVEKVLLGFASGVMIAASVWSLLIPSIDMASGIKWLPAAVGFMVGILFLLLLDTVIPHLHLNNDKPEGLPSKLNKSFMLVLAVTLHNIPEGMSIGVAFGGISSGVSGMTLIGAIMLAIGIGIQNFPEGAAVSLPLRKEGFSRKKSFFIGQASALVEPISAVIGVILVLAVRSILPILLSFAAGAMITVAARELLPESISENKNLSTLGLISGFVLMMVLDVALG